MAADQVERPDSPATEETLAAVYDGSEGGTARVSWSDVSDDLSSEQWKRLIEQDVLVSAGEGFVLADPERVQAQLAEVDGGGEQDLEFEDWRRVDKGIGLVVLALFAGYFLPPVRSAIASTESILLGPLAALLPFYWVVLVLAAVTGLYSSLLEERLRDEEKIDRYNQWLKRLKLRKEAAQERDDQEALERIEQEYPGNFSGQLTMFKARFRSTVWSLLLTIPVLLWLRSAVGGAHLSAGAGMVLPFAGSVTWQQPVVGPMQAWLVWYFFASVASSQIIQKTLDIGSTIDS